MTRRSFVKQGTTGLAATAAAANLGLLSSTAYAQDGNNTLRIGIIGCGGRGGGALGNCFAAAKAAGVKLQLVAVADLVPENAQRAKKSIETTQGPHGGYAVTDETTFTGMDAYKKLCAHPDVDIVIHTTPPGLRYLTLREAVKNGKHSFVEKPVCVDADTYHSVLESGEIAKKNGLSIVSGTQYRRENSYVDAIKHLQDGVIGDIVSSNQYYCGGTLWHRGDGGGKWDPMSYQMRNWYYFTWLSGDLIVEQSVHNIDAINWSMGGPPVKAYASGGRIARTDKAFGNIYDHFSVQFEYANGVTSSFMGRQYTGGTDNRVYNRWIGTKGTLYLSPNPGASSWIAKDHDGKRLAMNNGRTNNNRPYVEEHKALLTSVATNEPIMEIKEVADSSLTCVLGRESAYCGKELSFDFLAKESKLKLRPESIDSEIGPQPGPSNLPVPGVRLPGKYKLI